MPQDEEGGRTDGGSDGLTNYWAKGAENGEINYEGSAAIRLEGSKAGGQARRRWLTFSPRGKRPKEVYNICAPSGNGRGRAWFRLQYKDRAFLTRGVTPTKPPFPIK